MLVGLLGVVLVLILIGVVLWFVETQIPMAPPFKVLIRVVVILFLLLWLVRWMMPFLPPVR